MQLKIVVKIKRDHPLFAATCLYKRSYFLMCFNLKRNKVAEIIEVGEKV